MMDTPAPPHAAGGQGCRFCPTHSLNLLQLSALYAVSQVLNPHLDTADMLREMLRVLHDEAGLTRPDCRGRARQRRADGA